MLSENEKNEIREILKNDMETIKGKLFICSKKRIRTIKKRITDGFAKQETVEIQLWENNKLFINFQLNKLRSEGDSADGTYFFYCNIYLNDILVEENFSDNLTQMIKHLTEAIISIFEYLPVIIKTYNLK